MPAPVTMRLLAAAFLAGGAIGAGAAFVMRPPALHAAPAEHSADDLIAAQGVVPPPGEGAVSGQQSIL